MIDRDVNEVNVVKAKDDRMMSATELAIQSGSPLQYIYVLARTGRLSGAKRIDGRWAIPRQVAMAYIERCRQRAALRLAA